MVRGPDRDSLVVLPGTRDIKESGAYVQRGSMSEETQDTSPTERQLQAKVPRSANACDRKVPKGTLAEPA